MDGFFVHENYAWPPLFASNSTVMHSTTESDLISCVESMVHSETNVPNVDVKIIDEAGDPRKAHTLVKTFQDYCEYVFLPSIENMQSVNRLDIVWDVYGDDSLKYQARPSRGTGNTLRDDRNTSIPADWKKFLLYSHRQKQRWLLRIASHVYSRVFTSTGRTSYFNTWPECVILSYM